jgi:alpha-tubulin suppressor-like RCC1 family protein
MWGSGNPFSAGAADGSVQEPRPVNLPLSLCLERVKMIACSARHVLVLSTIGLVYSCGDNTEGALGVGDVSSRSSLQMITQWFAVPAGAEAVERPSTGGATSAQREVVPLESPPTIVQISAGAGIIGSHSVALSDKGLLYSWGVAQATGHGTRTHYSACAH